MQQLRSRWTALLAGSAAVLLGPLLLVTGPATTAAAAEIGGAIVQVTLTPTDPQVGTAVTSNIDWTIPDGTAAGDTFSLTLPTELKGLPASFTLTDGPGGPVVANASISSDDPAVVTFTMTAYAAAHLDVHGTAFITSGFDTSKAPIGETTPFTYTTNDGQSFTTDVTPGFPELEPGSTYKYGNFARNDNGRTDANDAIQWIVQSQRGPVTSETVTDSMQPGQVMDCASIRFQVGTWVADGQFTDLGSYGAGVVVSCDASGFTVTTGAIDDGATVLVNFSTSLTAATGDGPGLIFHNSAQVTTVTGSGTTVQNPSGELVQSDAGGSGSGQDPTPDVTIVKDDTAGHHGDSAGAPVSLPDGSTGLVFTVTNTGNEPLTNVDVTDVVNAPVNGTVSGLACDFSPYGGPAAATHFNGNLPVNRSVTCTATLTGVEVGSTHHDTGTVTADGALTGNPVDDTNPYYAERPAVPGITILKGDSAGNAADTAGDAVTVKNGTASLVFRVTNSGTEPLTSVVVSDQLVIGGTVTGLSCTFPDDSTGTTWAGPFAVGASFPCTAKLSGVAAGTKHQDIGHVAAVGVVSGSAVTAENPYFAVRPPAVTPTPGLPADTVGAQGIDTGVAGDGTGPNALLVGLGWTLIALVGLSALAWPVLAQRRRRRDS